MNDNEEKIRMLLKQANFSGNITSKYLFTPNCVDYFFYERNIRESDLVEGITDGPDDGGIDFIYSDDDRIYIIQGKDTKLNSEEVTEQFTSMLQTFNNFSLKKKIHYNDRLEKIFTNKYYSLQDPDIVFVLFTSTKIDDRIREKFDALKNGELFNKYTCELYGEEEINEVILNANSEKPFVSEGTLKLDSKYLIDKNNKKIMINKVEYSNSNDGCIVTIKANSLASLYKKYSEKGLFGYNLRKYIRKKLVDDRINDTILNEKDNFWFYNNGITIVCSKYIIEDNILKLYNFSIINGAQTTTQIGNSKIIDDDYDFSIMCKVIKADSQRDNDFLVTISEATNNQKPILPRDLKANSKEQKLLQELARDNIQKRLFVDIKRGYQQVARDAKEWEKINNEQLGQLLLSAYYQRPGTARNQKKNIFEKKIIYEMIFGYERVKYYNYSSIHDLVHISNIYDEFKKNYYRKNCNKKSEAIQDKINISVNAKFCIISILYYFYKRHVLGYHSKDNRLNEKVDAELNYISEDELNNKMYEYFKYILGVLYELYRDNKGKHKISNHTNFFKTDNVYSGIILEGFEKKYNGKYARKNLIEIYDVFKKD